MLFLGGFHSLVKFSAADAVDLGAAFRAGSVNDSAAALVEISDGILDLTLRLTFYTISFHCFLHNVCVYLSNAPDSIVPLKLQVIRIVSGRIKSIKYHAALKNKAGDI